VWRGGERVRLFTRRGFDWTERYPWIMRSARQLAATRFLIDGEAVCCGDDGVSDFARLHSRNEDAKVFLYGFDLLAIYGADIRQERLDDRRAKLGRLLAGGDGIRFSEHVAGDGETIFRHACKLGLEGIVCKRRDSVYRSGSQQDLAQGEESAEPGDGAIPNAIKRPARRTPGQVNRKEKRPGLPHEPADAQTNRRVTFFWPEQHRMLSLNYGL
jgi:bifunctional non-homologous end joining protein LigD